MLLQIAIELVDLMSINITATLVIYEEEIVSKMMCN